MRNQELCSSFHRFRVSVVLSLSLLLLNTLWAGNPAVAAETTNVQAQAESQLNSLKTRFPRPAHDRGKFFDLLGDDRDAFMQHVYTLANPYFEGRCPGTAGNALAADYIAFYMERFGLQPLFTNPVRLPDGSTVGDKTEKSYLQPFSLSQGQVNADATFTVFSSEGQLQFTQGKDFNAMGISANKNVYGEIVFVGYAIEDGPDGYNSFQDCDDLTGKIALVLRFEPVDEKGHSLWAGAGRKWSRNAGLMKKLKAARNHGAAGILLVSPPDVDDTRAKTLESANDTRIGRPLDIPALLLTPQTADAIIKSANPHSGGLTGLVESVRRQGHCTSLNGAEADIATSLHTEELYTSNVAGVLPGQGNLADQYIIIGSHYDHIGYGKFGSRGNHRGVIHVGADDNASGVAGNLVLAKRFVQMFQQLSDGKPRRSIIFICFSGEEMGLLGSANFVNNSPVPLDSVTAMLNMDMIGNLNENQLTVYATGTAKEFKDILTPLFEKSGLKIDSETGSSGRSDEASFLIHNVPALHFFSGGHDRYHTPRDLAHYVNYDGAIKILDLVQAVATDLAHEPGGLTYQSTARMKVNTRRSEIKIRFGIAPGGMGETTGGVLVSQVIPGTTAAEADLKPGDRLIGWDGKEVTNISDWMDKMKLNKPGDKINIVILRDGKKIEKTVTLRAG